MLEREFNMSISVSERRPTSSCAGSENRWGFAAVLDRNARGVRQARELEPSGLPGSSGFHTVPQPRHHPLDPRRPSFARPDRSETRANAPAATRLERSSNGDRRLIALYLGPAPARRKRWQSLRPGRHVSMHRVHTRTSSLRYSFVGVARNGTRR